MMRTSVERVAKETIIVRFAVTIFFIGAAASGAIVALLGVAAYVWWPF